ncbi:hypothetical protein [Arthrobacter sp. NPDC092385]|uniref:hypothetical protein n=1 Tax=Arthrobacter sp. NPDC092385 TaxID=3363943 RepID=UPI00130DC017|nr:hypothetical protein [Vibrio cholerae]
MDPATSAAIATWVRACAAILTFVVAVVAVFYAKGQLDNAQKQLTNGAKDADETRKLQRELLTEQAQPYVVVTMEESRAGGMFIDLVVKNYGTTAAQDVKVSIDPHPERAAHAGDKLEQVKIPETIHVLAPGQEWRTFWDSGNARHDSGLPSEHAATVTYAGIGEKRLEFKTTLSWEFFESRLWLEIRGMHDLAKATREIDKKLGRLMDGNALSVLSYDGHFEQERRQSRLEAKIRGWRARHAASTES